MNKVILSGHLGRDPKINKKRNRAVLSLATSYKYTDKQTGEKVEVTDWHRVVYFNRLAELCDEYLKSGSKVLVEGKLKTSEFEQDGEKRWITEVYGESLEF